MLKLLQSDIGRLRIVGVVEGCSLLLLFFVAMPLKYGFGMPEAVRLVGSIHGGLFLVFAAQCLSVTVARGWKLWMIPWLLFLGSLPFGSFYADAKYLKPRYDEADQGKAGSDAPA